MRVLIDTNILIYREDDRVISENVQELLALLQKTGTTILIHPISVQDLKKDRDIERQEIILSKVRAYNFLESPPDPQNDVEYLNSIQGDKGRSEIIDNSILYAVYKDAVDFLITEDKGIHKKAHRIRIDDRVLFIDDAILLLKQYIHKEWVISPPALTHTNVYNLNLKDSFFDSLKREYDGFEKWFKRISKEGRKCWVHHREDSSIRALLIYKLEDEPIVSDPPFPKKKRLKLSTFKVTYEGHKIGELFIKLSVDIAIQNDITEIYLTHFTDSEDRLVELISEYGFKKVAVNHKGEAIFLKKLVADQTDVASMSPTQVARVFYPSFYDGLLVKKFIVPIRPEYHNRLFTDFPERQLTLSESVGDFIIEGNTIRKAYICHSKARRMQAGDVLLFYLSRLQKVTSLGTVESAEKEMRNSQEIFRRVGKRTVYSLDEIEEMAKKPTTVILFRQHFHLKKTLSLEELKNMGVLAGSPQSIILITDESYGKIRQKGGIDARFTVH